MKRTVTIIDYDSGNLLSVMRAFEHCGADVVLAHSAAEVESADRLVVPGVGAFADGMAALRQKQLVEPIRAFAAKGRPLLGICLGMQMLATASEEFGRHEGLGLVPGEVVSIPRASIDGTPFKVPHVGWSELYAPRPDGWRSTVLDEVPPGSCVYLVHSFRIVPANPAHMLATCNYGGHEICTAVQVDNVMGCQFHPEKSGPVGLKIIDRFVRR